MSETLYLSNVRMSFPHIGQPHASGPNAPPKYSTDLLMPMADPQVAKVQAAAEAALTEVFKEQTALVLQQIPADPRLRSFGDGNLKVKQATMQPYEGYVGNFFVVASNALQPQIIKADGQPCDPANTMECAAEANKLYGGCYANVAIKPWVQNNSNGRTVRWDLVAVQFATDGEAFGEGRPNVEGMFGAVAQSAAVPPAAGIAAPVAPPSAVPPAMQPPAAVMPPVMGPDGQWHDPQTGAVVAPPAMPGYPQ